MDSAGPARRELFGGAIVGCLHNRFQDVSQVRQVPDHQECFADGARDESLLVEILELKSEVQNADSARFFFQDLATANDALSTEITKIEALAAAAMPQLDAALVKSICVGTQTISKGKDDASAANVIQVLLANIRLPMKGTDILITLNTPLVIHPESSGAEDVDCPSTCAASEALETFMHFLRTFSINDWGLFGE